MRLIKYKHIIALFIVGFLFNLFGTLNKILHTPSADSIFIIAFVIMAISGVLAITKLLFAKNNDSFLDK